VTAEAAVAAWLDGQPDLPADRAAGGWLTVLPGENRRNLPVFIEVGERTVTFQAFFMAAPEGRQAELYAYLLRRHARSYVARFALDPSGDVLLVAVLPVDAVTVDELDRVLGQLLQLADDTYLEALRLGFGAYIEREQAWRERVGLGRNPIT
jgi:hypothetical protein